jgi:hypothetical protein
VLANLVTPTFSTKTKNWLRSSPSANTASQIPFTTAPRRTLTAPGFGTCPWRRLAETPT